MQERRHKFAWLTGYTLKFLILALVYIAILVAVNFYVSWKMLGELQEIFHYSSSWKLNFFILQLSFLGVILTLLVSLFLVVHRSLGPLVRIERIIDSVLKGDFSLRITVRKKDILQALVGKINLLIELAGKGQ